mmetsp:Transcript_86013/g.266330  ORF Transcript_86013/g.266330 Transcript_86013/m.266330 type:complete len:289 (+) Transcript_86013:256-1122(+)
MDCTPAWPRPFQLTSRAVRASNLWRASTRDRAPPGPMPLHSRPSSCRLRDSLSPSARSTAPSAPSWHSPSRRTSRAGSALRTLTRLKAPSGPRGFFSRTRTRNLGVCLATGRRSCMAFGPSRFPAKFRTVMPEEPELAVQSRAAARPLRPARPQNWSFSSAKVVCWRWLAVARMASPSALTHSGPASLQLRSRATSSGVNRRTGAREWNSTGRSCSRSRARTFRRFMRSTLGQAVCRRRAWSRRGGSEPAGLSTPPAKAGGCGGWSSDGLFGLKVTAEPARARAVPAP